MGRKFLVGVGACYIDLILGVPYFPEEDEKVRARSLTRRRGGNCPNTFEVLQQLTRDGDAAQVALALCSVLPSRQSTATKFVKASLGPKVDISHCVYREESTEAASSYIIRSAQTGSRTIVNYNDLAEMSVAEMTQIVEDFGEQAHWYHFEGRIPETARPAILYIRERFPETRISVEVEKPGRDGLRQMAELADVVFYSKSWAAATGYQSAQECVRGEAGKIEPADRLLCCTWGDQGAVGFQPGQQRFESAAAFKVEGKVVQDTIGAGDTFIAGMLYGLIYHTHDWSLLEKLQFANKLAGRKVLQEGFGYLGLLD